MSGFWSVSSGARLSAVVKNTRVPSGVAPSKLDHQVELPEPFSPTESCSSVFAWAAGTRHADRSEEARIPRARIFALPLNRPPCGARATTSLHRVLRPEV